MVTAILAFFLLWQGPVHKAEDDSCLRLRDGRFEARLQYRATGDGDMTAARAVSLQAETGFDETGYFWLDNDQDLEVAVRVFDACSFNGHFWVFAASLTKVEYELTVTDTETSQTVTYFNPLGNAAPPIQDTQAFATCPVPGKRNAQKGIIQDSETLALLTDRFQVEIDYRIPDQEPGRGTVGVATETSGAFWFLDQSDFNVYLKIEDQRSVNGRFWLAYSSLTGAEFTMRVTDRETGLVKTYFNPLNRSTFGTDIFLDVAPTPLLYPWISDNDAFGSTLALNNNNCLDAEVTLTATRGDGADAETTVTIPAGGFLEEAATELFPELNGGSGYSVLLSGPTAGITGSWVTNNLNSISGNSPSQGLAVSLPAEIQNPLPPNALVGPSLQFGLVPLRPDSFAGLVTVNTGATDTDVVFYTFSANGRLLAVDEERGRGLKPFYPLAFIPTGSGDEESIAIVAHASNGNPLVGVTFFFNGANEPSIANSRAIEFAPPLR